MSGLLIDVNYQNMVKKLISLFLFFMSVTVLMAQSSLMSPDNNMLLKFKLDENGTPVYNLDYKGKAVIANSKMGFRLSSNISLSNDFEIVNVSSTSYNESWTPVWGQYKKIYDHHNEMLVSLKQHSTGRLLNIRFRLFNDGLGFRYEFPVQDNLRHFIIKEELTQFCLTGDDKAFWIPADYDTNEFPITTSRLSEISG